MDDVAAREVPVYFEVEEEIISAPSKVWNANPTTCCLHRAPSMGCEAYVFGRAERLFCIFAVSHLASIGGGPADG